MITTERELNSAQNNAYSHTNALTEKLVELLTQAVNSHQAGQLPEAENLYRDILELDPSQPNANHNLGVLALDAGEASISLDYFRTALDNDPDEPQFWISYVDALIKAGQTDHAREVLMQGLELGLHGDEVNILVDILAKPQKALETPVKELASDETKNKNSQAQYKSNSQIQKALTLLQAGKLNEAKAEYKKLLKFYPKHPHILSGLGSIELQQGNIESGVQWLEQSLALDANQTTALSTLGIAYCKLSRLAEALESCGRAIALNPNYAEAHANKANALKSLKRYDEAIESYKTAISLKPNEADNYFSLGSVHRLLKQNNQAVTVLQQGLAINPYDVLAQIICADALQELGQFEDAARWYSSASGLDSTNMDIFLGRGVAYLSLKNFEAAREDFEHVVKSNPRSYKGYLNLGVALQKLGRFEEALHANQLAIDLNSTSLDAYCNRGLLLVEMRRLDEAAYFYDKAIELGPESNEASWNKSLLKLLVGEFAEGWALYESRWNTILKDYKRSYSQPLWLGKQSIAGKTLFIYPEQGFGDFIQFCRYVTLAEAAGAKVILEVPKALTTLISGLNGNFKIVQAGSKLPDFDFYCPIMSLPFAFKTALESIPTSDAYLYVDKNRLKAWQERLGEKTKARVGLVWSGAAGHANDHLRSLPLEMLKPLFSQPIEFHVLQKEIKKSDSDALLAYPQVKTHQDTLTDFSETAALIESMDLVITVDTSVAHLAAAMGKQCWILLAYSPDFRWMLNRTDSPWYPTVTLFRQSDFNEWVNVISQLSTRLEAIFGAGCLR